MRYGNGMPAPVYAHTGVRPKTCVACALNERATTNCVSPRGSANPLFLVVGEAPGQDEDSRGQGFVGRGGTLLETLLHKPEPDGAAIPRDATRLTYAVRCMPKDAKGQYGTPPPADVKTCVSTHLLWEIAQTQPKLLIALGKTASVALTGNRSGLDRMRSFKHPFRFPNEFIAHAENHGYRLYEAIPEKTTIPPNKFDPKTCRSIEIPVVVTYSPGAALNRKMQHLQGSIVSDLIYARKIVYNEPRLSGVDYRFIRTVDEVNQWKDYLVGLWRSGHLPHLSLDLECAGPNEEDGLHPFDPTSVIVTAQIAYAPGKAICIPLAHPEGGLNDAFGIAAVRDLLWTLFDREAIPAIGQNLKFDYKWLWAKLGIKIRRVVFDSQLAHQCLYAGDEPNDLDYISAKYCGFQGYGDGLKEALAALPNGKRTFLNLKLDQAYLDYSCGDVDAVYRAKPKLEEELVAKQLDKTYQTVFIDAFIPLAEKEINGLPIDLEIYRWLQYEMPRKLQEIMEPVRHSPFYAAFLQANGCPPEHIVGVIDRSAPKHIVDAYDFNPGSAPQKCKLFFEVMGLPKNPERVTEAGQQQTDKKALAELYDQCAANGWTDHAMIVKAVQEFAITSKLYSGYIVNLEKVVHDRGQPFTDLFAPYIPHDRVQWTAHPILKQDGTQTGRLSSSEPPIHNMPQKSAVKRLFKSRWRERGGLHLQFDYSAMEVRVLACLAMANCPVLKKAFAQGFDAHKYVASIIFGIPIEDVTPQQRKVCKTVNFAVLYGAGPDNVASVVGVTKAQAEKFIADYLGALPAVTKWKLGQEQHALKNGVVRSAFGRLRYLSTRVYSKGEIERRAVNTPIQSTASDVTLTSYIRLYHGMKHYGFKSLPYLFVHDSLGFDTHPGEFFDLWEYVQYEMAERPPQLYDWLDVPLVVDSDAGFTWGAMSGVERIDRNHWKFVAHENEKSAALYHQLEIAGHRMTCRVEDEILDSKPAKAWYVEVDR